MNREQAVELVHGLVAIPSLSRQEGAAARWLTGQMAGAGYDRAFVDEAGNAIGELGVPDAATVIVLLGHIDTVPGNIPVRIAPVTEPENPGTVASRLALFGRGSVDAKGPLATFAAAGARLGSAWAREMGVRLVVVGAVEEEAATSKGARFIAARFDGVGEPKPAACVIGEPSSWRRITLGYKGRLLMDVAACQAMAHTAGPDAGVAEVVVDLWNWVRRHADETNTGKARPFDQLSPSLRRFITANTDGMTDTVDAQIAWRLPVGFDAVAFVNELLAWTAAHLERPPRHHHPRFAQRRRLHVSRMGEAVARRSTQSSGAQLPCRHPAGGAGSPAGFCGEDRHQRHERRCPGVALPNRRLRAR
jgi:LysW-gamma-L-lysine carboxypeptidase